MKQKLRAQFFSFDCMLPLYKDLEELPKVEKPSTTNMVSSINNKATFQFHKTVECKRDDNLWRSLDVERSLYDGRK